MSALRVQSTARLLPKNILASQRISPILRRFESSSSSTTIPVAKPDSSLTQRKDQAKQGLIEHIDFDTHVDHGTSTFSPAPKRIMDGSEPGDVVAAAVLSGAPIDLQARTVRIYKPAKPATQSGDWHSHHWRMDWDILSKGHRWENPLMGWQSSADAMQGTHISFKSKDDAIRFAEKQGYEYWVQEPNERKFAPKAYASQFVYSPTKLKTIRTK